VALIREDLVGIDISFGSKLKFVRSIFTKESFLNIWSYFFPKESKEGTIIIPSGHNGYLRERTTCSKPQDSYEEVELALRLWELLLEMSKNLSALSVSVAGERDGR
jgi:hypothetical protein